MLKSRARVHDLRVSFIWFELLLHWLEHPDQALYADQTWVVLAPYEAYKRRYYGFRPGSTTGVVQLQQPWPESQLWEQSEPIGFWQYYLESLGYIAAERAYNKLVPLRSRLALPVAADWPPCKLLQEAYYYPHGIAYVLTAQYRDSLTLQQAVELGFNIYKRRHTTEPGAAPPGDPGPLLDDVPLQALALLRQHVLGLGAAAGERDAHPFSVATVVRGSGVQPWPAFPSAPAVQRSLEALTTWDDGWESNLLPPVSQVRLPITGNSASEALYAHQYQRAAWSPALFTLPGGHERSLSAYHRNLVALSLHVHSLTRLVCHVAEMMRGAVPLPVELRARAVAAAGALGRLYGGVAGYYRYPSAARQIDDSGAAGNINLVRSTLANPPMPPLHSPPPPPDGPDWTFP